MNNGGKVVRRCTTRAAYRVVHRQVYSNYVTNRLVVVYAVQGLTAFKYWLVPAV